MQLNRVLLLQGYMAVLLDYFLAHPQLNMIWYVYDMEFEDLVYIVQL